MATIAFFEASKEALRRISDQTIENIQSYIKGNPTNIVK